MNKQSFVWFLASLRISFQMPDFLRTESNYYAVS